MPPLWKKEVIRKNDLGSGLVLGIHCASANDDLGMKLLPPGEEWGFNFHTAAVGSSLFHCSYIWAKADKRSFAVYDDNQHHYVCTQCHWSIQTTGACLYSDSISQASCYPWAPAWPTPSSSNNNVYPSAMN
ncbi:hypothetical protein MLD38_035332 [Melastoma candidum]|uniref:Uncharacterized protein n=1 Tax=Melastoma candidum TaxID=119954 RepID=A0ACB9LGQ0_9MYRT|nr:hypothetical protein MLD38_035332 [Melastoma candidum]